MDRLFRNRLVDIKTDQLTDWQIFPESEPMRGRKVIDQSSTYRTPPVAMKRGNGDMRRRYGVTLSCGAFAELKKKKDDDEVVVWYLLSVFQKINQYVKNTNIKEGKKNSEGTKTCSSEESTVHGSSEPSWSDWTSAATTGRNSQTQWYQFRPEHNEAWSRLVYQEYLVSLLRTFLKFEAVHDVKRPFTGVAFCFSFYF